MKKKREKREKREKDRNDIPHLKEGDFNNVKGKLFLITNNKGHENGWATKNLIYGKVIKINGKKY